MDTNNNKKYKDILLAGRELFFKHGFRRVSIEEVCRLAGVSKMTYYRFFPNKIELAKAVLDKVMQDGLKDFRAIMSDDSAPSDKIKGILHLKLKGTNDISQEFLNDFYNNPELGLTSYLEEQRMAYWYEILNDFRLAQEKGWFRSDFKPEFLIFVSEKMSELIFDKRVGSLYANPQELILELANLILYGISAHD
jgi:AcrR family transcriptional regulator